MSCETFAHLKDYDIILTVNQRLSRVLNKTIDEMHQSIHQAWKTPQVMPFSTWLKSMWEQHAHCGTLLTPLQTLHAWKHVIMQQDNGTNLNPIKTAQLCLQTDQLIHQWHIDTTSIARDNHDVSTFLDWRTHYTELLANHKWVTDAMLGEITLGIPMVWQLIKDKRIPNLFILAASQTRDKDILTKEGVGKIINELKESFDYIVCDSPAGIERGAHMAMYYADAAFIVTNPEVSSVRDSDRILGLLQSKTQRAENGESPIEEHLIVTRYCEKRVNNGDMLSINDIKELLGIPLIGVIPESKTVLSASNAGTPVILNPRSEAGKEYQDIISRFLGLAPAYTQPKKKKLFDRIFRKEAEEVA